MDQAKRTMYLEDPNFCPFCDSTHITGIKLTPDAEYIYHTIRCDDCGKSWHEIYKLVDVEPIGLD